MGYAAWPTATDVTAKLQAAGITAASLGTEIATAVNSAPAQYESRTRRRFMPYTATNYYAPPSGQNPCVSLGADLLSVTGVTLWGNALMANVQPGGYILQPQNYANQGYPYFAIQLTGWVNGNVISSNVPWNQALAVTGQWGYASLIPDDAWEGVLCRMCAIVRDTYVEAISKSETKTSVGQGDLTDEWDAAKGAYKQWMSDYTSAVNQYVRTLPI